MNTIKRMSQYAAATAMIIKRYNMKRNIFSLTALIVTLTLFASQAQSQTLARSNDRHSNFAKGSLSSSSEFSFLESPTQASNPFARRSPTAASLNLTAVTMAAFPNITGNGTPGNIPYFSAGTVIRDSMIFQSKQGNIGIGTTTPGSKVSVGGMIESLNGGIKFPDGTVQATAGIAPDQVVRSLNTLKGDVTLAAGANIEITPAGNTLTVAAPNALTAVAHDSTLTGDGTAASPLSVVSPESFQEPFAQALSFGIDSGETNNDFDTITTVPSGKRLVVEHVSGGCELPVGQRLRVFAIGTKGPFFGFHDLLTFHDGDFNTSFGPRSSFRGNTPMRLLLSSGTVLEVFADRGGDTAGSGQCFVTISGYFINEPLIPLR